MEGKMDSLSTDDDIINGLMCQQCKKKQSLCSRLYDKYFKYDEILVASDDKFLKDRMNQIESFIIDRDIAKLQQTTWSLWILTSVFLAAFFRYTPIADDIVFLFNNLKAVIFTAIAGIFLLRYVYNYAFQRGIRESEIEYGG